MGKHPRGRFARNVAGIVRFKVLRVPRCWNRAEEAVEIGHKGNDEKDGVFSLEKWKCIGACTGAAGLAGQNYGLLRKRLRRLKVRSIIGGYGMRGQAPTRKPVISGALQSVIRTKTPLIQGRAMGHLKDCTRIDVFYLSRGATQKRWKKRRLKEMTPEGVHRGK